MYGDLIHTEHRIETYSCTVEYNSIRADRAPCIHERRATHIRICSHTVLHYEQDPTMAHGAAAVAVPFATPMQRAMQLLDLLATT